MTMLLRGLRGTVSAMVLALAFTGFGFNRAASRLAGLQKNLTNKIGGRDGFSH